MPNRFSRSFFLL